MSLMSKAPAAGRLGSSAVPASVALCAATTVEMTRAGVGNSMSVVSQIKRDKGSNGFALNAR